MPLPSNNPYSLRGLSPPKQQKNGNRSRGNSIVSAIYQAGQALGAVAAPGPTPAPAPAPATAASTTTTIDNFVRAPPRNLPYSPSSYSTTTPSASPATATANPDYLPPPYPAVAPGPVVGLGLAGTGAGTGTGTGSSYRASSTTASASDTSAYSRYNPYSHVQHPSSSRSASYAPSSNPARSIPPVLAPPNTLMSGPEPSSGSGSSSLFDLPSIPTSTDDFASIPFLNSSTSNPNDTMSQQQQQLPPQQQSQFSSTTRRPVAGYGAGHEELHMSGSTQYQQQQQHGQMSPREYSTASAGPQIKLEQAPPHPSSYQGTPSVPGVLQPGGMAGGRPGAMSVNTVPTLPTIQGSMSQQQEYQTPAKPSLNLSHSYSRSSPSAGGYDGTTGYTSYTPTTPGGGASSSQFMSPTERSYNAPGSQRNISHTPLGLADIRPRADSSLSDGLPGSLEYAMANTQPGTSNYMAPWAMYAFDWCKWAPQGNGAGKLAVGSYLEDGHNFIQILDTQIVPTPSDIYSSQGGSKYSMDFTKVAEATHSYPVTRLLWEPPSSTKQSTDLLATSGDHLRLWSLPADTPSNPGSSITSRNRDVATTKLTPLALLSNSKTPDHTAPLTSLDWNTVSPSLIITSSIDTTCTIWDIPSLTAKTQLIAHDKEVYDVRFCANSVDQFVSCGQDGSVRMFDLRSLEHSTIIYEPTGKEERDPNGGRISPTLAQQTMSNPPPLLRLATSPHDQQLLATFAMDSNIIRILDVRQPGQALLELRGHGGSLNCVDWSPTRRGQLASGGDDCQVLIWDLMNNTQSAPTVNGGTQPDNTRSPVSSWQCDYEVGNLGWIPHLPNGEYGEWLGVGAGRGIWGVRMN